MEGSQSPSPGLVSMSPHGYPAGPDRPSGQHTSLSPRTSRMSISAALPMLMPNAPKEPVAPPALPPPRHLPEFEKARQPNWEARSSLRKDNPHSRPVSPLSTVWPERKGSGAGESFPRMQVASRRQSSTTTIRSPLDSFDPERDEGYGSLSGTSLAQLQGERSLDRQNRKDSSHAYDKSVLSKIGGPRTPTRASTSSTTSSIEGTGRPLPLKALSISDSLSAATFDSPVSSKWLQSPQSVVTSPGFGVSVTSPRSLLDSKRNLTLDTNSIISSASGSVSASASASGSTGGGTGAEGAPDTRFSRIEPARTRRSDSSNLSRMMAFSASSSGNGNAASGQQPSPASAGGRMEAGAGGSRKRASDRGNSLASETASGLGGLSLGPQAAPGMAGGAGPAAPGGTAPAPVLRPHPNPQHHQNLHQQQQQPQQQHHRRLDRLQQPPPTFTTPSYNSPSTRLPSSGPRHAMVGSKRKASSPARGPADAEKPPPQTKAQQLQHPSPHSTPVKRSIPLNPASFAQHPTSAHPASSGAPNGSYAPSPGFAVGASSASAPPHDAHREYHPLASADAPKQSQSTYAVSGPLDPSITSDDASYNAQLASSAQMTAAAAQKLSAESPSRSTKPSLHPHMCNCCPKKPKKFSTYEELRQHEGEKQYGCQYCNNRFKNKNEAERHRNSLHLRRHSWSCATLEHYAAAFHPCTAVPPNTSSGQSSQQQPQTPQASAEYAQFDVCGYCGRQFPNHPEPDWVVRSQHLTEEHKFGECNQSKKFFRADHFRQHLKHSHGGTSGKWTNMLEAACMKDEPPVTAEAQAESAQALAAAQQQQQHQQGPQGVQQSQVSPPRTETQLHPQARGAAGQQPGSVPAHGAPVANLMQPGQFPMMGGVGGAGRSSSNGADFQFSTIEEESKTDE